MHQIIPSGSITIGWSDFGGKPTDAPIAAMDVMRTAALRKAARHLAVEIGAKKARRHTFALARRLKRLAAQCARRGEYLQLHTTNQSTAPAPYDAVNGLGIEVRAIRDHMITFDLALYSADSWGHRRGYLWRVCNHRYSDDAPNHDKHAGTVYRHAPDAGTLVRRAIAYFPAGYDASGKAIWREERRDR